MPQTQTAAQIAAYLLESQAVRLRPEQPFKWSSGWNSPIYCDNRVTLSYPHIRSFIKEALAQAIRERFSGVQAIAGVATAGIAQGALVADILNLPYLYVRPEPKSHGMGNQIEGKMEKGQRIVLVEDLISTGGSSLKAAKAVQAAGGDVIGMAAIFTYGFQQAEDNFAAAGIPMICLSHYHALLETAAAQGYISPEAITTLEQWRQQPETWGK
ncbi:orotate phosphoribosyltransferase [Rufibacter glacialis]|uniref:Orotate phosphoribosyltransferase n=1 Tax=Rufibacter glacialis TaxID=1259555 RepID=A0A5M8QEV3_9BACT|nr:orotate phosphoribosyltransferase [Rufibacter glacialis]KAA6434539.1 orotate phosphoribosyltransferase [Rufibacter glacialis]GGK70464.1 orotate phosphoribosyltransferase [Rufibacter glacialis]